MTARLEDSTALKLNDICNPVLSTETEGMTHAIELSVCTSAFRIRTVISTTIFDKYLISLQSYIGNFIQGK